MNLYSIRPAAGGLFIAGEAGTCLQARPGGDERFDAVPVDYAGSLFGVADAGDAVLVFGLRGNAVPQRGRRRDLDQGRQPAACDDRRWHAPCGPGASCWPTRAGGLRSATTAASSSSWCQLQRTLPLTSIVDAGAGDSRLTGPFGVMVVAPELDTQVHHHGSPDAQHRSDAGRARPQGLRPQVRQPARTPDLQQPRARDADVPRGHARPRLHGGHRSA